jgi:hypothetical protein
MGGVGPQTERYESPLTIRVGDHEDRQISVDEHRSELNGAARLLQIDLCDTAFREQFAGNFRSGHVGKPEVWAEQPPDAKQFAARGEGVDRGADKQR